MEGWWATGGIVRWGVSNNQARRPWDLCRPWCGIIPRPHTCVTWHKRDTSQPALGGRGGSVEGRGAGPLTSQTLEYPLITYRLLPPLTIWYLVQKSYKWQVLILPPRGWLIMTAWRWSEIWLQLCRIWLNSFSTKQCAKRRLMINR